MGQIVIVQGDICKQKTEAIVNAANNDLLHGGGVAGAIVKCGGKKIQKESDKIGPIPLGEAAVTSGGKLSAKYVIHAASMKLGELATEENVRKSIANSFKRAREAMVRSIAFPAVGAGIAGFPIDKCAQISLQLADENINNFDMIIFVLFSEEAFNTFQNEYKKYKK
ncbi:macro domain-containing protein [Patescibacteria group bacterium]|nr:macro domain-containing protein [Patescibacteria group bacterium]